MREFPCKHRNVLDSGPGKGIKVLHLRVYENLAEIEALRSGWEGLLSEFHGATIFSSWEWLAPWWRAFGERRQLLVLAFLDESSRLVGLAPLSVEKQTLGSLADLTLLRFLGDGSGDSDNLDFPARTGYEDEIADAFLGYLAKESKRWDYCELNTMPEDSPVGRAVLRKLRQQRWPASRHQQTGSAIQLPETWDGYRTQLSAKERAKVAYRRNLLEKKYKTRFYQCASQAELAIALDTLFALHQKRWESIGEPGSFKSPARRDFYRDMASLLLARGHLQFWLLDLDGKPAAAQFGFCFGQTFFSLQEGYDPVYSPDSVGYVLRAHVIRQLIGAGMRRYDFLAGESASKSRWDAGITRYASIHFARPKSMGSIYLQTVQAAALGKEWLRFHLPKNAWKSLHWLNCTMRGIRQ